MRKFAKLLALVMAVMAASAQRVWDGTKWIARAAFGPPVPAGAGIEEAFDDVAQALRPVTPSQPSAESVTPSAPAPKPAPAPAAAPAKVAQVVELDPVLARGKLAHRFAHATFSLEPEESILKEADEVLRAWLLTLNAMELMTVHRSGAHRVAAHLAGKRLLEGLPEIATAAEFTHFMGRAARMTPERRADMAEWDRTMDQAYEDMIADPAYVPKCGV